MTDCIFSKRYGGKSGTATIKKQDGPSENEGKSDYGNVFDLDDLDKYPRIKPGRKVIKYVQVKSD